MSKQRLWNKLRQAARPEMLSINQKYVLGCWLWKMLQSARNDHMVAYPTSDSPEKDEPGRLSDDQKSVTAPGRRALPAPARRRRHLTGNRRSSFRKHPVQCNWNPTQSDSKLLLSQPVWHLTGDQLLVTNRDMISKQRGQRAPNSNKSREVQLHPPGRGLQPTDPH